MLCIQDSYSSDFIYKPKSFTKTSQSKVPSQSTAYYQQIISDGCPSDYSPIFCTIQPDEAGNHQQSQDVVYFYGNDIDTSSRTCSFNLFNLSGNYFQGTIGVLCAKSDKVKIPDYKTLSPTFISIGNDKINPFFKSQVPCDSGIATQALTFPNSNDYTPLLSMVPTSDLKNFVAEAYDYWDKGINKKVGVACLNYPNDAFLPVPPSAPYKHCCVYYTNEWSPKPASNDCTDTSINGLCGLDCSQFGGHGSLPWVIFRGGELDWACNPWSFSMSVNPSSDTAIQGTPFSQTVTITVTTKSGTPQPVSFSYSFSKSGVAISQEAQPCTPSPSQCTSTFKVSTGVGTQAGTYKITVTGTSGSASASAIYSLTVAPQSTTQYKLTFDTVVDVTGDTVPSVPVYIDGI